MVSAMIINEVLEGASVEAREQRAPTGRSDTSKTIESAPEAKTQAAEPATGAVEAAGDEEIFAMLRATSRTFALSIERLPSPLKEELAVAYLLLRVSDYLEDHETLPAPRKVELLRLWQRALGDTSFLGSFEKATQGVPQRRDDPEAHVVAQAGKLLAYMRGFSAQAQGVILAHVGATTKGMARWQEKGAFVEDELELDDYMHQVAGIVGYLITDLFALYSRRISGDRRALTPLAREFGLALQSVNVIRGLKKDHERGWIYVPSSYCAAVGIAREQLFSPEHRGSAMLVVERLVEKAEQHLQAGMAYIRRLPRRFHKLRLACMWPLLLAAGTLGVSRGNPEVLSSEAKLSRKMVKRIIAKTMLFGWSNTWLANYTQRLVRG